MNNRFDVPSPSKRPSVTPEEAVVELGRRGRTEILPKLAQLLDANPRLSQQCSDLVAVTEAEWIYRIVGQNLVQAGALAERQRTFRAEHCGPTPSVLVKHLVDSLAVTWLEYHYAALVAPFQRDADGPRTAKIRLKQLDSAQRRYLACLRTLALVRRAEGSKVPMAMVLPPMEPVTVGDASANGSDPSRTPGQPPARPPEGPAEPLERLPGESDADFLLRLAPEL